MVNGKKPNLEQKKWIDAILEHGCIVCRNEMGIYSPAELHHTNGGSNHLSAISLCMFHHRSGLNNDECTSRHPHKHDFEVRYGSDDELLIKLMAEVGEL